MITQCCECKKVRHGDRWAPSPMLAQTSATISHGYCPACAAKALKAVEEHYAQLTATGATT